MIQKFGSVFFDNCVSKKHLYCIEQDPQASVFGPQDPAWSINFKYSYSADESQQAVSSETSTNLYRGYTCNSEGEYCLPVREGLGLYNTKQDCDKYCKKQYYCEDDSSMRGYTRSECEDIRVCPSMRCNKKEVPHYACNMNTKQCQGEFFGIFYSFAECQANCKENSKVLYNNSTNLSDLKPKINSCTTSGKDGTIVCQVSIQNVGKALAQSKTGSFYVSFWAGSEDTVYTRPLAYYDQFGNTKSIVTPLEPGKEVNVEFAYQCRDTKLHRLYVYVDSPLLYYQKLDYKWKVADYIARSLQAEDYPGLKDSDLVLIDDGRRINPYITGPLSVLNQIGEIQEINENDNNIA